MTALTVVDKSTQFDTLESNLGNKHLGKYDRGGVVQAVRFTYTNDSGDALADGDIVKLAKVANCLILPNSFLFSSAMGTGRTLDVGVQEYVDYNGTTVASNIDALLDGLDVSAAVEMKIFGEDTASLTRPAGLEIKGQADILAKIIGGTLPANGTLKGMLFIIST
jgi:hypothetical protein